MKIVEIKELFFSPVKMKNIVRYATATSPRVCNDDKHLSGLAQRTNLLFLRL